MKKKKKEISNKANDGEIWRENKHRNVANEMTIEICRNIEGNNG